MERGKCDKMEQIKIDGNREEEKWPKMETKLMETDNNRTNMIWSLDTEIGKKQVIKHLAAEFLVEK